MVLDPSYKRAAAIYVQFSANVVSSSILPRVVVYHLGVLPIKALLYLPLCIPRAHLQVDGGSHYSHTTSVS
jgi:hypothetical protein